ncbi:MAG: DUF456 domain-containing protein [Gammaproteobacteria bacterium]|jgi:uncharacterized protein YqgC (DUF456 family)|nr:DUF456 domain-containing protein [Gammaproteobacteria bacterium]
MEWMDLLWIVVVVLIGGGLAGAILPVLPGPILIYAGILLAAWLEDFQYLGLWALVIMLVLTLIAHGMDFFAGMAGARSGGATRAAMLGAAIGSVVGLFFGLPGLLIGPFVGAVIGEFLSMGDLFHATRAGVGAWLGTLVGIAVKTGISFFLIGWYLLARLW